MNCLDLKNVTVDFGSHLALNEISFEVEKGSFVSVVGPNGGGKSTLIKVLLGLIKPTHGSVLVHGDLPSDIDWKTIGYVPQIKTLDRSFPAIPLELVATGLNGSWSALVSSNDKKLANEALEQVGALHLAKRQLSRLSGGEMQRIYLARSIVRKPRLLLLDEPSTGIDSASEKDLIKLIEEYSEANNATVLMVTHDWEAAMHHSTKVLMLNRSVICFSEPEIAFCDENLRKTFGHIGHKHDMRFGAKN